jgi:quinol monooxygenase YgiN
MELFIFARFRAHAGKEKALEALLRRQVPTARSEPGCLAIDAYRSTRDCRLFWIHSRWVDETAFDVHAELADTIRFVEKAELLIDHPFDVTRSRLITRD